MVFGLARRVALRQRLRADGPCAAKVSQAARAARREAAAAIGFATTKQPIMPMRSASATGIIVKRMHHLAAAPRCTGHHLAVQVRQMPCMRSALTRSPGRSAVLVERSRLPVDLIVINVENWQ